MANTEELKPWMTTSLCALNPLTGTEEVLYSCPGWRLDRKLAEDALWFEDEEGRILCRPLGDDLPVAIGVNAHPAK